MAGLFKNQAGKGTSTGKRAVFVPVIIGLLALLPVFNQTMVWFDLKISDFLFSAQPLLQQLTGKSSDSQPPVLVINKDQTFFQRFGRDPDRADFASLLRLLADEQTRVAGLDFIYDQPATAEKDGELTAALASYPWPFLASHFIGRGAHTFEKLQFADAGASRPPMPLPLYQPLARQAAATGLINVAADLDATVRFAPLAFHPADSEEFLLSLGASTWIASLFDASSEPVENTINNLLQHTGPGHFSGQQPDQVLLNLIASAPFNFSSTGHAGLDFAIRRLELRLLARQASQLRPEMTDSLLQAAADMQLPAGHTRTWLKLPDRSLPLIGSYQLPCLRLPFRKAVPPFTGDCIETMSMGMLLETDADRESTLLNHRNLLQLEDPGQQRRIRLGQPEAAAGSSTFAGKVQSASGKPLSDAEVLLLDFDSGFWELTKTDSAGNYHLSGIPAGSCTLQITAHSSSGWQRGTIRTAAAGGHTNLPVLVLADATAAIKLNSGQVPAATTKIAVFGEPLPMLTSDAEGRLPIESLPAGFNISALDEEINLSLASGTLCDTAGKPSPEQTVAILSPENGWTMRFLTEISWPPVTTGEATLLPTALDARIAVFAATASASAQKTIDLTLLPGGEADITQLPALSQLQNASITLSFDYPGLQPFNLTLLGETGTRITCKSDQTVNMAPGKYLLLYEHNGARGIFRNNAIHQKTVFIGSALPSDQDFIVTPINFMDKTSPRLPGVNLHANLFAALVENRFLYPVFFHHDCLPTAWPLAQMLLLLPVLLLINLIFIRHGAIWGGLATGTAFTAWFAAGTLLFLNMRLLPMFFPGLLLGSFGVVRGYLAWAISRRQEQETRQTFGRFISSAVVDDILKNPDAVKPGGEKKELTVIFTDLAGFTTISEKLAPEQLTELMNEYLDEMTRILFQYGGTLDKYIGDAIMGFWNHPAPQPDHAQRAVECAIAMQKKLAELRRKWLQQGLPRVEVRAGINTAVCMVGFIGSEIQMNFTCLGDGVNLASRLEGANKAYGTLMMIADSVHNRIDRGLISTRFLDFLAVKGKDRPVEVFEVRGYRRDENELWLQAEAAYKDGISLYLARNWEKAIAAFSAVLQLLPEDGPAQVYIDRCEEFKQYPPPENWDGRYILKSK